MNGIGVESCGARGGWHSAGRSRYMPSFFVPHLSVKLIVAHTPTTPFQLTTNLDYEIINIDSDSLYKRSLIST